MAQVKIGPSFFAKAKNDYSNWYWALIREALQNCFDAPGSTVANVVIEWTANGDTLFHFENNGSSMDELEMVDKLLALGESGKDGVSTVGGFGKAKELLYLTHEGYTITSGDLHVVGCGGEYTLSHLDSGFNGTRSVVCVKGDVVERLCENVRQFAMSCQWHGTLTLNGQNLCTRNRLGHKRRDLGWAAIYTNNSCVHRMIVRVHGIPMFTRYVSIDKCIVVELSGTSLQALSANRDSLQWEYSCKLDSFVTELTVDKSKALSRKEPTYIRFTGEKFKLRSEEQIEQLVSAAYATVPVATSKDVERMAAEGKTGVVDRATAYDEPQTSVRVEGTGQVAGCCSYEFIVKNSLGMRVPDHFLPGYFSAYSKRLVKIWIQCLMELHRVLGRSDDFAVGFVFDDEIEALHESGGEYGRVYYINPACVTEQKSSKSRSLRKRWKFNADGKYALLSRALHEFVHQEAGAHDESYATRLTKLTGVAMGKIGRLRKALA